MPIVVDHEKYDDWETEEIPEMKFPDPPTDWAVHLGMVLFFGGLFFSGVICGVLVTLLALLIR